MFTFTRKTDYALVALSKLATSAREDHESLKSDEQINPTKLSARAIAEEYDLPLPLLMNILKDLQKAGIITSTRGAHGGYYLALPATDLSLLTMIEAIEGPLSLTLCCQPDMVAANGQSKCMVNSVGCPVQSGLRKLHEKMMSFLSETSLQDLLEDAQNGVSCECVSLTTENSSDSEAQVSTSVAPAS